MSVTRITTQPDALAAGDVLRLAGAVEQGSEHPLGRAITAHATHPSPTGPGDPLPAVTDFRATAGVGVTGLVEGRRVVITSPDDHLTGALAEAVTAAGAAARTCVQVTVDGRPEAVLELGDPVRPGSYRAVDHLRRLGIRPVLTTGDREAPAHAVAAALGITDVHARCTPQGKADLVSELRAQGHRVAVLGDGVNDAAALARADLGIAMGGGTDTAAAASDVTLVRADIHAVADAVRLARRTLATIRVNLTWAFAYNLVTLPLAATGWLDPMLAAVAMSASSLLVVGNSLRLRTWKPQIVRPTGRTRGGRQLPPAARTDQRPSTFASRQ